MIQLETFYPNKKTDLHWPDEVLAELPCGLMACPLVDAPRLLPELSGLYESVPIKNPERWLIDVKIHMLMPNSYPCVPNWHCDFIPRNADGDTDYERADNSPLMFLWVSGTPVTYYAASRIRANVVSHADVAALGERFAEIPVEPQRWYQFSQLAPHRGSMSEEHCWRVFARLTHRELNPPTPTRSKLRRHAQVYLDASEFTW